MSAGLADLKRGLCSELHSARRVTDELFSVVRAGSFYERPIPERHRMIFYLGHLEAFDWNLIRSAIDERDFQPELDRLFAFGIDPDSTRLPQDRPSDWPSIDQVHAYNGRVREKLDPALARVPEQLLHVAIEHRLMHAETFAYMLHNLGFSHKVPQPVARTRASGTLSPRMVEIPAGTAALGREPEEGFGWDNEFRRHTVEVPRFAVASHKVTNGEFLEFVERGADAPHFWAFHSGRWFYRGMFQEIPLPFDWPVYVSYTQAVAYASWKGKRLLSEPEYHRAAFPDGAGEQPDPVRDNFDFAAWEPIPVQASPENSNGVAQMVGNGWEWTSTVFHPFSGFQPFPFYPGYSADFFDGRHYVLKGASPRTASRLTRPSFRNWFRASYPYVYATFRLADS